MNDRRSHYGRIVERAIEHLIQHLDDPEAWEADGAEAGLSAFHFFHLFRGMVGESPVDLARRLRLERAAWHLAATRRQVLDVALEAGYRSGRAFTTVFRTQYGCSPTLFRARKYPQIELPSRSGVHFQVAPSGPTHAWQPLGRSRARVSIEWRPALRLATLRHGGRYDEMSFAFDALLRRLGGAIHELRAAGSKTVAVYHDSPNPSTSARGSAEAGVTIPPEFGMPPGLVERLVPAGRAVSLLHHGASEERDQAWDWLLGEWLPASDVRIAFSPGYEVWADDPSGARADGGCAELVVPLDRRPDDRTGR